MLWNAEPGAKTDLCCINKASFLWIPFEYQWFGLLMGIVLPVAVATVLGFIMFRKRISGVFVSIITLALVLLVRLLVIDAQPLTNGFNGLTDLGWFKIGDFEFDPYNRADLLSRGRYARGHPGGGASARRYAPPGSSCRRSATTRTVRAISASTSGLSDVLLRRVGRHRESCRHACT